MCSVQRPVIAYCYCLLPLLIAYCLLLIAIADCLLLIAIVIGVPPPLPKFSSDSHPFPSVPILWRMNLDAPFYVFLHIIWAWAMSRPPVVLCCSRHGPPRPPLERTTQNKAKNNAHIPIVLALVLDVLALVLATVLDCACMWLFGHQIQ